MMIEARAGKTPRRMIGKKRGKRGGLIERIETSEIDHRGIMKNLMIGIIKLRRIRLNHTTEIEIVKSARTSEAVEEVAEADVVAVEEIKIEIETEIVTVTETETAIEIEMSTKAHMTGEENEDHHQNIET